MFQRLRVFARSDRANVAIIFGLTVIPVLGLAGAAIDYSGAARDRSTLQSALDAGTLAGSKVLATQTQAQARAVAESYIRANLPERMRSIPLTIAVVNNGQSVSASAATTYQNGLLPVIGIATLPVTGSSIAQAPSNRRIEAVLALDNTGSMASSGKIQALRTATLEFLSILENSGRPAGDVRVGIVPFDTQVRVGTAYRNANWLRSNPGGSWTGCVQDRQSPYNTNDTPPTSNATRFVPVNCAGPNLQTIQPLTSNFSTLRTVVNGMNPSGNTNVTIGVAWGWHLLSDNEPFTESAGPNDPNVDRWLLVLTDGDNTQDAFDTNQTNIDARTRSACNALRTNEPSIRVLTVRVIDGDAALLRACASSTSDYYEVANASELVDVFRRIAWTISSLRLTN